MKKILVMEDEPDVATSIKAYLEEAGYEVQTCMDPANCLPKLSQFDLLVLDLIMPKLSGHSLLKKMKENGIKMPVVVLSAVGLPKLMGEQISRDFPGVKFIPKTEMYSNLLPVVEKLIGN